MEKNPSSTRSVAGQHPIYNVQTSWPVALLLGVAERRSFDDQWPRFVLQLAKGFPVRCQHRLELLRLRFR